MTNIERESPRESKKSQTSEFRQRAKGQLRQLLLTRKVKMCEIAQSSKMAHETEINNSHVGKIKRLQCCCQASDHLPPIVGNIVTSAKR